MKFIHLSFKIIFIYFLSLSYSYSIETPNIKNLIVYEERQKIKLFDFLDEDKNKVNLTNFNSDLIILNFWATWCVPCREEMPSLDNLQSKNNLNKIVVIPINIGGESLKVSNSFFEELNISNLKVYIGEGAEIAKLLKLRGLPTTIFIDKDGKEFARIIGSVDFNSDEFLNWINNIY